jgi:hypothetical protein
LVEGDNQACPKGVVIEYADNSRGTGGDKSADSCCEIITCCARKQYLKMSPLGFIDVPEADPWIE